MARGEAGVLSQAFQDIEASIGAAGSDPHDSWGPRINNLWTLLKAACGAPSNMEWQTLAEGKAKDVWERRGCRFEAGVAGSGRRSW